MHKHAVPIELADGSVTQHAWRGSALQYQEATETVCQVTATAAHAETRGCLKELDVTKAILAAKHHRIFGTTSPCESGRFGIGVHPAAGIARHSLTCRLQRLVCSSEPPIQQAVF